MNKHQRQAERDMMYLAKAWRIGFVGPPERPASTRIWQQMVQQNTPLRMEMDAELVDAIHSKWLRLSERNEYMAVLLKLAYRDGVNFDSRDILKALLAFHRA